MALAGLATLSGAEVTSFLKLLDQQVLEILKEPWKARNGYRVPTPETVRLLGGAVKCEGTVLYADLAQSSFLATELQQRTAAKTIKCFLRCCSRLITKNTGTITSFDGDRVMGIFVGENQETRAVLCGLQIHAAIAEIVRPRLKNYFDSMTESAYDIDHCVGIDRGEFLAVRAGHSGSTDLIWVGRAPNLAAKLSAVRDNKYKTVITNSVYNALEDDYRYSRNDQAPMWEKTSFPFLNEAHTVYASGWWWRP